MTDRTPVVTYRPVVRKDGNCKLGYGAQMTDEPDNRDSDWRGEDSRQWVKHSDYAALESLLLDARAEVRDATLLLKEARKFLSYIHPAERELLERVDLKLDNIGFTAIDAVGGRE